MIKALPEPEATDLEQSIIDVINNHVRRNESVGNVMTFDHVIAKLEIVKQIYVLEYLQASSR